MDVLQNKKKQIFDSLNEAKEKAYPEVGDVQFLVEYPRDKNHGDFATNIAMVMAKAVKTSPKVIAEKIIENLDMKKSGAVTVEVAGAGFINFTIDKNFLYDTLKNIETEGENYGNVNVGNNKKVMVEFVSANPTGPMHMGNARGGALGDLLSNVLKKAGYDVYKEFYVNDAGAQIDKFGRSLEARYIQALKGEDAVEFPEDGYMGEDIKVHAQNYIALYGDSLLEKDESERRKALSDYALPINLENMKKTLKGYGIEYDNWFFESSLYNSNEVKDTIELLKKSNVTYEKDGALWLRSTELGLEKDDVLVRQNGIPTYFAADIAYHRNKISRGFDLLIDIWGADHHGHIARMKGALEAIGIDKEKLQVPTVQLVRLMRDGEVARMSKRTGKMITLGDLVEEIGIDAARFFFNMRAADTHMDFDLDLAVEQSNENPVFYVQYAHARICSIIRLLEEDGIKVPCFSEIDASLLNSEQEIDILKKLASLPEEIETSAKSLEPSRLTRYVLDLSSLFHSFYNACRIRGEEENLLKARLVLIDSVRKVLEIVLKLLYVKAPEKM